MPPPSLSITTNVAGPAAPSSPFVSCRKHRSPQRPTIGAGALACATPTTVDTNPSMPLAPRFASTRSPSRGAMHHSSARTGRLEPTTSVAPSGQRGRDVTSDRAFAQRTAGVELTVDRGARRALRRRASRPTTPSPADASQRVRDRREQRLGVDLVPLGGRVVRIEPARRAGRRAPAATDGIEPGRRDLARERRADAHHELGSVRVGESRRAQQRLVGGDRERTGAQLGERVGEHRPTGGRGEALPRSRASRRRPIRRRAARAGARARARPAARRPRPRARRRDGCETVHGRPSARPGASTNGAPVGSSGSRNGRFRCTGPAGGRASRRPRGSRARATRAPAFGSSAGGPGSLNQRTASPKRCTWSIV